MREEGQPASWVKHMIRNSLSTSLDSLLTIYPSQGLRLRLHDSTPRAVVGCVSSYVEYVEYGELLCTYCTLDSYLEALVETGGQWLAWSTFPL